MTGEPLAPETSTAAFAAAWWELIRAAEEPNISAKLCEALIGQADAMLDRLAETPATTAGALAAKVLVWNREGDGGETITGMRLWGSIVADAQRLAGPELDSIVPKAATAEGRGLLHEARQRGAVWAREHIAEEAAGPFTTRAVREEKPKAPLRASLMARMRCGAISTAARRHPGGTNFAAGSAGGIHACDQRRRAGCRDVRAADARLASAVISDEAALDRALARGIQEHVRLREDYYGGNEHLNQRSCTNDEQPRALRRWPLVLSRLGCRRCTRRY